MGGFWAAMETSLRDSWGVCAFPALETATFSWRLFDATINVQGQGQGQITIADNTKFMPNLDIVDNDYSFIRFVRDADQWRFGFFTDMTDEDLKDQEVTDGN